MLEFNRQLPAQGAAALGEAAVLDSTPARLADDLPEQAAAGFALLSADWLQAAAPQEPVAEVLAGAEQVPAEDAAEQWLLGMLGQRELQVEAREPLPAVTPGRQVELATQAVVAADLPGEQLPVQQADAQPTLLPAVARLAAEPQSQSQPQPQAPVQLPVQLPVQPETRQRAAELPVAAAGRASAAIAAALATAPVSALSDAAVPAVPESLAGVNPTSPAAVAAAASPAMQRAALDAPEARLGEQMLHALRNSVETQVRQGIQQTSIRLDPPELGSMEIFVSHESGRLTVQISASNIDVARLLQQTSERLRQELVASNFLQVNVQVGSEGHSGRQQGRPLPHWQDADVRAAQTVSEPLAEERMAGDVLITV